MNLPEKIDPFTDSVLRRIGHDVRESLTTAQLTAITEAISGCRPLKKHPLDIRGVIPLFFTRYYFVLLMGRDRRRRTQEVESERRLRGSVAGSLGMMGFVTLLLLSPAIVIALYYLKTLLGINIYADKHAWDVIKDILR